MDFLPVVQVQLLVVLMEVVMVFGGNLLFQISATVGTCKLLGGMLRRISGVLSVVK
jgi:hypothetical protein